MNEAHLGSDVFRVRQHVDVTELRCIVLLDGGMALPIFFESAAACSIFPDRIRAFTFRSMRLTAGVTQADLKTQWSQRALRSRRLTISGEGGCTAGRTLPVGCHVDLS